MREGLYQLKVRPVGTGLPLESRAIVMLRHGRFFGSDACGAILDGSCSEVDEHGMGVARLNVRVPPSGELVTGFSAGAGGEMIEIVAAFARPRPASRTIVDVGGSAVEVEIEFVGSLRD